MTAATHDESSETPLDRASRIIAQSLAQGLMEAEVIIAVDRDARAGAVAPELLETLERFGGVLTRLVEHTERLAERLAELTEAVAAIADSRATPVAATPRLPEFASAFRAGGEGIDITISSVPGFQELMELQRALVRLPHVQSAAVHRFQDDEAGIQLVLSQAATGASIADAVAEATGYRIVVEESRADSLQLRLRFLDGKT